MSSGRKATVLGARGRVRRTPPGSESGACIHRGSSGTWESPLSPCHMPGMGDRVTTSPGVVWGPRPGHEPVRDTTNEHSRQGIGKRATSEATGDGQCGSLSGAEYLGRWGTEAHRTHWREGNAGHHVELDRPTGDTVRSPTVTPKLQRLAAQAAHDPDRVCTTLAHLIDTDFLREASHHTSTSSAAGIDGVTAQQYAEHLDENVRDLHERLRSDRYQAAPVERVWIEKDDGGQRPIGKPTFEEKSVQRAVALLLEAIDEQDFSDGS